MRLQRETELIQFYSLQGVHKTLRFSVEIFIKSAISPSLVFAVVDIMNNERAVAITKGATGSFFKKEGGGVKIGL